MGNDNVTSAEEWKKLSEPQFPLLESEQEKGSVFEVKKVGFYMASKEECEKLKLPAEQVPGGKYALPTAFVKFGAEFELCKLPTELTGWVSNAVAMAHSGMNAFPCSVEFGELNGRKYAEIL